MARASSWAGCRVVASGRRAMTFLLKMVTALTIGSTGTRPAAGLTGIGGRKHVRFVDGTVRRGPAAQPTDPGPEPCRPVHHQLALGRAPGGDQVPSRSRTTARYSGQGSLLIYY